MNLSPKQIAQVIVRSVDKEVKAEEVSKWLIQYLAKEQSINKINEIIRAIDDVWQEHYGAANITIETAYPISEELRNLLNKISKGASVSEKVNDSLIGGARLRIDDKIIDGSISGTLNNLKSKLVSHS